MMSVRGMVIVMAFACAVLVTVRAEYTVDPEARIMLQGTKTAGVYNLFLFNKNASPNLHMVVRAFDAAEGSKGFHDSAIDVLDYKKPANAIPLVGNSFKGYQMLCKRGVIVRMGENGYDTFVKPGSLRSDAVHFSVPYTDDIHCTTPGRIVADGPSNRFLIIQTSGNMRLYKLEPTTGSPADGQGYPTSPFVHDKLLNGVCTFSNNQKSLWCFESVDGIPMLVLYTLSRRASGSVTDTVYFTVPSDLAKWMEKGADIDPAAGKQLVYSASFDTDTDFQQTIEQEVGFTSLAQRSVAFSSEHQLEKSLEVSASYSFDGVFAGGEVSATGAVASSTTRAVATESSRENGKSQRSLHSYAIATTVPAGHTLKVYQGVLTVGTNVFYRSREFAVRVEPTS